jgi:HEPN domain-containing protein
MDDIEINKEKLISYWLEASDDDFDTMISMYESKRFNWALFVGHLMIEKLLKAYYVKIHSDYPPFIHNLYRLAEKSEISMNEKQKEFLITVTAFNINARYDDYKMSFKKRCTPDFTQDWIRNLKELREWILGLMNQ